METARSIWQRGKASDNSSPPPLIHFDFVFWLSVFFFLLPRGLVLGGTKLLPLIQCLRSLEVALHFYPI